MVTPSTVRTTNWSAAPPWRTGAHHKGRADAGFTCRWACVSAPVGIDVPLSIQDQLPLDGWNVPGGVRFWAPKSAAQAPNEIPYPGTMLTNC